MIGVRIIRKVSKVTSSVTKARVTRKEAVRQSVQMLNMWLANLSSGLDREEQD